MSSYPASPPIPLLTSPARQALDAIQRIIQHGLPDLDLPSPAWDLSTAPSGDGYYRQPTNPAPFGHWLLPEGEHLYRADLPETVRGNHLILETPDKETRLEPNDPRYWLVPCRVRVLWIRQAAPADADAFLRFLEMFLTVGFKSPGGDLHHARHYLSGPGFHVWHIRDIQTLPVLATEDGWKTSQDINFTLLCCACFRD